MQSESGESSWPATSTDPESKEPRIKDPRNMDGSLLSESGLHYTRPRAYSIQTKRLSHAKLLLASDLMGWASLYRATGRWLCRPSTADPAKAIRPGPNLSKDKEKR